ncbi:MAG: DsbA family protein [Parvibaculum sp.]|uniref:DsbA family protein n=1 Tax=Parvibaculum sp. TaxID=2024848 RepID=UPI0025F50F9E|nr:DsbA family protein [Parvibaculum sp.]MCE9650947.1 DsbA family protein [Parvibaculum sp.]
MKIFLMRMATTVLTSRALRNFRRSVHALKRRLAGRRPTIHYFHQADDPYSHVAAQTLQPLLARYKIDLKPWLVSPPDDAAAPERDRLRAYALRDAGRLAAEYGFEFPSGVTATPEAGRVAACNAALAAAIANGSFVAAAPLVGRNLWSGAEIAPQSAAKPKDVARAIAKGDAQRKRLGHYLSAMFYFEGEWYWGVDRLNHLEERLTSLGLDNAAKGTPAIAPYRDMKLGPRPASDRKPVIEYWFSFRSPYSWISAPRMRRLAKHYGCELRLRFILPMVMRGLPVPGVKRLYIMLDTKREADRAGLPYGTIVDPVGPGAARALAVLHRAIKLGRGEEFAELGMRAAFADGIELASDKGMLDVARRAGLSAEETRSALADESWKAVAEENRLALFDAGLWGAPTFRVDGKPAHWGQDRFWALEQDIIDALEGRNG